MQDIALFSEVNTLSGDNPRIVEIQRAVCAFYHITMTDLLSHNQARRVAWPRQVGMYLAKYLTLCSLALIGKVFERDHTTVLYAVRAIEGRLAGSPELIDELSGVKEILKLHSDAASRRIRRQLARIARTGFVPNAEQRSPGGQAEYIKALADIPPHLLELAVDRLIREREDKWFPLPAQIRSHISAELAKMRRETIDQDIAAMKSDLRAKFPNAAILD